MEKDRVSPGTWQERKEKIKHRWARPFIWPEWALDWTVYRLRTWAFLDLLDLVARFTIIFAVIFYFVEADDRRKQKHYQAWQVINSAQGKGGSGGRIQALEELKREQVSLAGVDLSKGWFLEIDLQSANLQSAKFWGGDLRFADFSGADLSGADLRFADLRGADLKFANLQNAKFWGARNLTIEQLSKVYTLYEAELDSELMEQIKKNYSHLLEEPKELGLTYEVGEVGSKAT